MEKRILVAFVLSFMVLFAWSTLNPPPKKSPVIYSQNIENKEFEGKLTSTVVHDHENAISSTTAEEKVQVLENDRIKVEFSNIGGTIKSLTDKEFNTSLPVTKIFALSQFSNSDFSYEKISDRRVTYSFTKDKQRIVKTYTLSKNDYTIEVNVQTEGMSNLKIFGYVIDSSAMDKKVFQSPEKSLFEYSVALLNQIVRKDNALEFNPKENKNLSGEVTWLGYRDRYFSMVIKPKFKTSDFSVEVNNKNNLTVGLVLADSALKDFSATIYYGPQKLHTLSSYKQGFENIMVFSNWAILDIVAKIIYFFVNFLHGILNNWGMAVLVLGLTLYVATYPLTAKSMSSMRKMQMIQPKMKALQDKYKNDPQRLNKEMMELYKENKVNPFGGCLPMLLQMPIFYGLYQVLWRSVDFKGASFLWIKDLSLPDRLMILPVNLPYFNNEFNILPILVAIIMFLQQKFSSRNMVITDPNQLMQQKMMTKIMPVIIVFGFYHLASGLCLYFTVFYLLSTLTQWKMSKVIEVVK